MTWTELKYTRKEVDKAGAVLSRVHRASRQDVVTAVDVISNWRAAHAFPLNTFQVGLRTRAKKLTGTALVAQRLKRLPTMIDKLRRMPKTTLSRFQDIGGCRAVVTTIGQVLELRDSYRKSRMKHQFVRERDYIAAPRDSGYRCIHLVYKFVGRAGSGYDGLQIEIQLRTRLQHAWATAVETVGTLIDQSLKSSEGSDDWLRFFALVGSAFAFFERTPPVPGTPEQPSELTAQIQHLLDKLRVKERLNAYRHALRATERQDVHGAAFFLLSLDPGSQLLEVTPFRADAFDTATKAYTSEEEKLSSQPGAQVVLVGSQSLAALRKAYPNYFLDTELFLGQLDRALTRLATAKSWPALTHPTATPVGRSGQLALV